VSGGGTGRRANWVLGKGEMKRRFCRRKGSMFSFGDTMRSSKSGTKQGALKEEAQFFLDREQGLP